jgi:putative Mn2+ efflux pump MntP
MLTVLLLALALSMDAFAAALTQGATARPTATAGGAVRIGLALGSAQAVMPVVGWGLGLAFAAVIRSVDHWVAFLLLVLIGGRMIVQGLASSDAHERSPGPLIAGWALAGLAMATSIDAAAAGVTITFLGEPILLVCAVIGAVTFVLSVLAVLLGGTLGRLAGKRAEVLGGLVLVGLGCKIVVEHVFLGS